MIRPSLMPVAKHCGYAVTLATNNKISSVEAEKGTVEHAKFSEAVGRWGKSDPATSHYDGAVSQIVGEISRRSVVVKLESEVPIRLVDPFTEEILSGGTTDLIATTEDGGVVVIDLKTGFKEVDHPDENAQILTYGAAVADMRSAPWWMVGIFYSQTSRVVLSRVMDKDVIGVVIDRHRGAAERDPNVAVVGPHCDKCYQRQYCRAWMLPVVDAEKSLAPLSEPGGLNAGNARKALATVAALKELLKICDGRLRDLARAEGGILSEDGTKIWGPTARRTGPSLAVDRIPDDIVEKLHEIGAYREGGVTEVFAWRKVKQ